MTNNTVTLPAIADDTRKVLVLDASNARQDARIKTTTAAFWDAVVAANVGGKRADIVKAVLVEVGEWKDTPQKDDNGRTPFGVVVQRFAARYDLAVKRADNSEKTPPNYLANIIKAVEAATKHGATPEQVADALVTAGVNLDTLAAVQTDMAKADMVKAA